MEVVGRELGYLLDSVTWAPVHLDDKSLAGILEGSFTRPTPGNRALLLVQSEEIMLHSF